MKYKLPKSDIITAWIFIALMLSIAIVLSISSHKRINFLHNEIHVNRLIMIKQLNYTIKKECIRMSGAPPNYICKP